jgi:NADPH-dependent glutamate synthase beta subunit-like oxidoreductase/NAD(P)H-flavin reductase
MIANELPDVIADEPLAWGFTFADLYDRPGLARLDEVFVRQLGDAAPVLREQMIKARENPASAFKAEDISQLIIDLAPHVEGFVAGLFRIESALKQLQSRQSAVTPLMTVKRKFVQKRAASFKPDQIAALDPAALRAELEAIINAPLTEASYVEHVSRWMTDEKAHEAQLTLAAKYAAWAVHTPAGKSAHHKGLLFKMPAKVDVMHLVPVETVRINGVDQFELGHGHAPRHREGFHLTDAGTDLTGAIDQADYCIKCHPRKKDSCSHGFKEKNGEYRKSKFGVPLAGCPLEERISEMNQLKGDGIPIGALAVVTIDNPMAAATGHRICNDCMKACIFQNQEPVDIPQVETRTLKDVLELPWGFEIYGLLTRWNPLNFARPFPKADTGKKVLVVGLGPAGFTLAHHLINDGHTVVAVDGLKIEPLPAELSGVDPQGNRHAFKPIKDVTDIYERLGERVMAGFGGVAEYGITVRWNKNFLKVVRLLLERRNEFAMYGGVRFGGAITVDSAFEMGFDHVALCMGAGRPTVIPMKNGLARGVRQASDFLMALQLTGAAKVDSLANLQVRMPIVVIGGGLTAIDTATESMAYYLVQIEKFLHRFETLAEERGEAAVRKVWIPAEAEVAEEFIQHAREAREERRRAAAEGRQPNLTRLINEWGGVTVAYRRRLIDAPSYTLNHEEVTKALEEGIRFAECLSPREVQIDATGAATALVLERQIVDEESNALTNSTEMVTLPARSILVAAGTQPNTVLAREDEQNVKLDGRYFQALDEQGNPVRPERIAKPAQPYVLMSLRADGKAVSFFGDLHPSFAGNVVKAMGGAKQGYPIVSRVLSRVHTAGPTPAELVDQLNYRLRAIVHEVIRLTPNIVEVVVRAPLAARAFEPGQFYRLQNYETLAPRCGDTVLAMEALALTGASVDHEKGLLSMIVLEMGGSSDICALLKPGEAVSLMGPTGEPTETPSKETVLLVGGGLGNAVLFSIGQSLRAAGSRVVYFAGYKKIIDRYKIAEIEKAADVITWCCDEAPGFTPGRVQDRAFVGNIVEAMAAYGSGALGDVPISLHEVDRLIVIGSDGMMRGVQQARHTVLFPYLKPHHQAVASINSPMQCMMKEICGQCLQTHKDPATGKETVVFSCANQDQPMDSVEWDTLRTRLSQNGAQEKLTKMWINRCRNLVAPIETAAALTIAGR